nr:putative WEB family protein At1g65010, chloroplastic [Ipomoea batatas]
MRRTPANLGVCPNPRTDLLKHKPLTNLGLYDLEFSSDSQEPGARRSGKKWHPSILSKTKLCRGDSSAIDSDALVSLERKPSKSHNSPQNRSIRVLEMPETEIGELEEEIRVLREQLGCAEGGRNQALAELREMRQAVEEANYLKEMLYSTRQELNAKDRTTECLKSELEKAKQVVKMLREAMDNAEEAARDSVSDHRRRIQELEDELEKRKFSEANVLVSFEQNKVEMEVCKREMARLYEKIKSMEEENSRSSNGETAAKEEASLKIKNLTDEVSRLENELKMATEAEEKSRKAMDTLASALKEVAEEATEAKETVKHKLGATQIELDQVKKENAKLKERVAEIEDKQKKDLEEAKKEMEVHKNAAERVRLEAEETLLAWNGKEIGFVSCIKQAEEERDNAQRECVRLRDILKQAISEANAAKLAANTAINESSKLKDAIADKEDALHFLEQEIERLKTNKVS